MNVIQTPSGRWIFVGRVPTELAYSGEPALVKIALSHGASLAKRTAARTGLPFKALSWETREAAEQARLAHDDR